MRLSRKTGLDLLAVVVLGGIVFSGYRYSQNPSDAGSPEVIRMSHACDLQRAACRVNLPLGGEATLAFSGVPVRPLQPFSVETRLPADVDRVTLELTGAEMDMGLQRIELQPHGDGRHTGQATLPVCVTGQMRWQATLQFTQAGRVHAVVATFMSER